MLNPASVWGRLDVADQRRLAIGVGLIKEGESLPKLTPKQIAFALNNQPQRDSPQIITK